MKKIVHLFSNNKDLFLILGIWLAVVCLTEVAEKLPNKDAFWNWILLGLSTVLSVIGMIVVIIYCVRIVKGNSASKSVKIAKICLFVGVLLGLGIAAYIIFL